MASLKYHSSKLSHSFVFFTMDLLNSVITTCVYVLYTLSIGSSHCSCANVLLPGVIFGSSLLTNSIAVLFVCIFDR